MLFFARLLPRIVYEDMEGTAKRVQDGLDTGTTALTVAGTVLASLGLGLPLAYCGFAGTATIAAASLMALPSIISEAWYSGQLAF